MDGIRLNDLEALENFGVDKQKIIEEITRAYAHQIYIDGFFNGDPHPGNFLVTKELPHRPVLLDFGLTKSMSFTTRQAFAKLFLASAEGDHVALLSALTEMGLILRLDIPEPAMEVAAVFFRNSSLAHEAVQTIKSLSEQRTRSLKAIQEKMKYNNKEIKRFNPVDVFPGDMVIFARVLDLLRGLSSSLNVRIVYLDIMRPFAEHVLQGNIYKTPSGNLQWFHDTPLHSSVEGKLRQLLLDLRNNNKILGIQVCAYKDGKVIIDTSAGVLGKNDPRLVQPDSLFPVFSATKGITSGLLHWLVDKGKLNLEENVANIWPGFGSNRKDVIKVSHILNHTSGLQNALADLRGEDATVVYDWDECLWRLAALAPETEPGQCQLYHYLSFGWLCGGIIEHASGRKFQEILEEALIHPLNIDGELYIGIPPGVESRLATLSIDRDDISKISQLSNRNDLPPNFQPEKILGMITTLPAMFNMLNTRRAVIPAANGHCSARALARYYAALADGGEVPPPHSPSSKPKLGSHVHIPKFPPSNVVSKRQQKSGKKMSPWASLYKKNPDVTAYEAHGSSNRIDIATGNNVGGSSSSSGRHSSGDSEGEHINRKIFQGEKNRLHEAFMGAGEFRSLALEGGAFGLGFKRIRSKDGSLIGFGHSGMGGSTGFCDIENRFSIAVTVNKMSFGAVTRSILEVISSELGISLSDELVSSSQAGSNEPLIN
ncbi:hypothetical protein SAY86_008037 [Trapa natans]|uniref:Uncharacterized protein n=1 Tax=Trapa natans TaxID=22666 RepID=A0AAN7R2R3_TRANT|nr:hypothetical protein SAY86_008037 [Trapa natans]